LSTARRRKKKKRGVGGSRGGKKKKKRLIELPLLLEKGVANASISRREGKGKPPLELPESRRRKGQGTGRLLKKIFPRGRIFHCVGGEEGRRKSEEGERGEGAPTPAGVDYLKKSIFWGKGSNEKSL